MQGQDARQLDVGPDDAGRRLDRVLADALGLSRAAVRRLLEAGAVSIGAVRGGTGALRRVAPGEKGRPLVRGERLRVSGFTPERQAAAAAGPPLRVLGEGPGWLAVDKPAGVAVHPLRVGEAGSALGFVRQIRPRVQGVGEAGLRSGVVHRLDVDTSGVQLFALDEATWQHLRAAFREHRVDKTYRALVAGHLCEPVPEHFALVVAQHRPARVRVVSSGAAQSRAGVRTVAQKTRVIERFDDATLVEIRPRTGFLHQIRATLAWLGHPVLGDSRYAPADTAARAPRQLLHAARLRFEQVDVASPDPPDLRDAVQALRTGRAG